MFSCTVFFKSSCTYGYDSIEHKLITSFFLKKKKKKRDGQSLWYKALHSHQRRVVTPLAHTGKLTRPWEVGCAEFI